MRRTGRYDVSDLIEGQTEPDSRRRVLRNLLGIRSKREINAIESNELLRTFKKIVGVYDAAHRFTAADLCAMHREWLGSIYEWAGRYRQVNLAKGGVSFAAAHVVPRLMGDFEQQKLAVHTPCQRFEGQRLVQALAEVHTDLLLIHPFREGNGRLARMLASLMALQAALPPLDFSMVRGRKKQEYFTAVQAGFVLNYGPMKVFFGEVIERSLNSRSKASLSGSFSI